MDTDIIFWVGVVVLCCVIIFRRSIYININLKYGDEHNYEASEEEQETS